MRGSRLARPRDIVPSPVVDDVARVRRRLMEGQTWRSTLRGVVAFAGLDHQLLPFGHQVDAVIAAVLVGALWRVAQAVLVAQIFFDLGIDLVDRLLFRYLEKAAA